MAPAERAALAAWLTPAQLELFDSMPPADRRHGLDVVARLRALGGNDADLLLAGLLHDCGKGPETRLWHRVAWSLGERYGAGIRRAFAWLPGFAAGLDRMRGHADRSAELLLAAGGSERAAELVRHQSRPTDPILGGLLRAADEGR